MIEAVILAGGLGTRIRSVLPNTPKVLAPVAGRKFLSYLLDQLADASIEKVTLCTGYKAEEVEKSFGSQFRRLRIQYSAEAEPLGTAGALANAVSRLRQGTILVLNGDSYCDVELCAFISAHVESNCAVSILLTHVEDASRFGSVNVNSTGRITSFNEKGVRGPGWINAGMYLLNLELLRSLPCDRAGSLEREYFPSWIEQGIYGHKGGGRFLDIGIPESFAEAQQFFLPPGIDSRRCIFLDRDGTINVEKHYLRTSEGLELLPGAGGAIASLRTMGYSVVAITNQSAIGRGILTLCGLTDIHDRLRAALGERDAALDGIYFCPHVPEDRCTCRKPMPGMLVTAGCELGCDPSRGILIGDKPCDIDAGTAVGATTILVRTGYGAALEKEGTTADYVANDLGAAVEIIRQFPRGAPVLASMKKIAKCTRADSCK